MPSCPNWSYIYISGTINVTGVILVSMICFHRSLLMTAGHNLLFNVSGPIWFNNAIYMNTKLVIKIILFYYPDKEEFILFKF